MSLLVDLMADPLEPGYARAAARRNAGNGPDATGGPADSVPGSLPSWRIASSKPLRLGATLTVMALVGFTLAVAGSALRPQSGSSTSVKTDLVRRIEERRAAADARVQRLGELGLDIATRRSASLPGPELAALNATLATLDASTGSVAVTGPGLVVTVDDAPAVVAGDAQGRIGSTAVPAGAVLARDIQQLVNGLWAAGAEAVDVNGQRLTSTAAITMAGRAIVVGYRPLTRPYVVTAIGPPELPARFTAGLGGDYLSALRDSYRIPTEVSARPTVRVAAGPALPARYARRAGTATATGPATGSQPDTSTSADTSTPPPGGNP